jgi:membrane protease YdiL (CAAX protease family)
MRAFAWFLGAILLAGILAALLGYPVYQLTTHFAHFAFHRVTSRIAMLLLIVELIFLCRHLAIARKADFGFDLPWRRFLAQSVLWGAIGALSALIGAAFLLGGGWRVRDPAFIGGLSGYLRIFGIGLSSGIAVALLEETVFRGGLHTAVAREAGPRGAAWLTAALFAILHLYAKARIPADELAWYSGFDLIARSFAPLAHPALVYDSLLSWFAIGLILSMTRILTGNTAIAIGLHAGWVLVLRMLQEATVSAPLGDSIWVGKFDGLLGLWMLPWALALGVSLWLTRARWVPAASRGF